ncbi:hypothetical protein LTR84_000765 [Exophiala bonariae]|uniref:protein-tyrosine-phosphatase n=1 Tax=Exophiala bonariae TaxID=1690606 RepID=A0AAV9NS15_9EURO|nr:hypothetical protein LTR84_000765 [Exophiala bonariae]
MDVPGPLSKCPGFNIYVDGFTALRRHKELQAANITHIVSAVDWKFAENSPLIRGFRHLQIPLDDVYDSNILEYFPRSNDFIHQGLNYWTPTRGRDGTSKPGSSSESPRQSGILVHCAMGVSRSATVVLAYLLWHSRQPQAIRTHPNATTLPSSGESDMVPLPPTPLSVESALALLREGRPRVEPNEGFIKQLRMYVEMGCPTTQSELENHKIYRRWMNSRNVMDALSVNRAPELEHITWRDEEAEEGDETDLDGIDGEDETRRRRLEAKEDHPDPEITNPMFSTSDPSTAAGGKRTPVTEVDIKCRKCRWLVAKSNFILRHRPPPHRDPTAGEACAHIFLHPLSWMKGALGEGTLDGRLTCPNPKCGANIGKFAWQGLRCSCGGWVTPGFGVGKAKIDEVPVRQGPSRSIGAVTASDQLALSGKVPGDGGVNTITDGTAGLSFQDQDKQQQQQHQHHPSVRLPPGMRRGGAGNL